MLSTWCPGSGTGWKKLTSPEMYVALSQWSRSSFAGRDDLAAWASNYPSFFDPIDAATIRGFSRLTAWANSRNYDQRAIDEFTGQNADYMLIAHAMAHNFTVGTNERPSPDSRKRILIPDACAAMKVDVSDTFTMMRRCGVRLRHQ